MGADPTATLAAVAGPMVAAPYRVLRRRPEVADTVSLDLVPEGSPLPPPRPGQFMMLWAFGVGEVPISLAGFDAATGELTHTIRAVGAVTAALCAAEPGETIGVRGPFGTGWGVDRAAGGDLLVVAGGLGLAPVRPVMVEALDNRHRYGRVALLVGARDPGSLLYVDELERWRGRFDLDVEVTVDAAPPSWRGDVGVVTKLLDRAPVDPARTIAVVCGPEVMMRFVAQGLVDRGFAPQDILLSMERNMRCAIGHCGHCQLGPLFICKDGPVLPWTRVAEQLMVRER